MPVDLFYSQNRTDEIRLKKRFTHPLQVSQMSGEQLAAQLCNILNSQQSSSSELVKPHHDRDDKPLFSLIRKRVSKPFGKPFFLQIDTNEFVGTLEAFLPYVVLQRKRICKETEKLFKTHNIRNFFDWQLFAKSASSAGVLIRCVCTPIGSNITSRLENMLLNTEHVPSSQYCVSDCPRLNN